MYREKLRAARRMLARFATARAEMAAFGHTMFVYREGDTPLMLWKVHGTYGLEYVAVGYHLSTPEGARLQLSGAMLHPNDGGVFRLGTIHNTIFFLGSETDVIGRILERARIRE